MPDYQVSGEKNGDIWHENSRKLVFEFRLLGEKGKGVFCKSLLKLIHYKSNVV